MPRPKSVQTTRDPRKDGSITFGLRVRMGGTDERVPLGNSNEGWDETRVETARKQLLAKIELDLWTPGGRTSTSAAVEEEPTFRELATDWLADRKRNPGIRPRTTELNESQLTRLMRRADREELRQELRDFIETSVSEITPTTPVASSRAVSADGPVTQTPGPIDGLRRIEKAGKAAQSPRDKRTPSTERQ